MYWIQDQILNQNSLRPALDSKSMKIRVRQIETFYLSYLDSVIRPNKNNITKTYYKLICTGFRIKF